MSNRNRRRTRQPVNDGQRGIRMFTFEHNGKVHTLPPASDAAGNIPAGVVMDAVEAGDEMAQFRLGVAMLNAAGASPEAMAALRDMPMKRFGEVLGPWMKRSGVNPGESERSST